MLLLLFTSTANAVWISPSYHAPASENYWFQCEMAYDNIDHTFAYEKDPSARHPLDLIFPSPVNADWWSVSLWGEYGSIDSFELWLFYDDQWNLHWDGSVFELPIATTLPILGTGITKARIVSENMEHALCVLDVKLWEVPEPATILLLIGGSILVFRKNRTVSH